MKFNLLRNLYYVHVLLLFVPIKIVYLPLCLKVLGRQDRLNIPSTAFFCLHECLIK